jgi:hypothetical protein
MLDEATNKREKSKIDRRSEVGRRVAVAGWGLFFIWIGIVLLKGIVTGISMLGIGIIALGVQAVRMFLNIGLEGFWIFVGLIFVLGGIWGFFETQLPLLPIVLIIAGVALLLSAVKGKRR